MSVLTIGSAASLRPDELAGVGIRSPESQHKERAVRGNENGF